MKLDEHFMREALKEAERAKSEKEIPIGAVVVCKNQIVARGHNMVERLSDVTAHAEMIAITAASEFFQSKYLNECTLYVTLEPCSMCAAAIGWAQIGRVVFGASDDKKGFLKLASRKLLHPRTVLQANMLHDDCAEMLKAFFRERRKRI